MTNTERIQANNAGLLECIELAESLPDAGEGTEVVLQSKTVTPTKGVQEVTPDTGYTALEKVTVEAIPDAYIQPAGTLEITENGLHDVAAYASVNVDVASGGIGSPDLPEGCTHASCIYFTGKQIVDTGRVCTQNTKIRVVFTRESNDAQYMYGVVNSGNTASVTAYLSSSGTWRFGAKSVSRTISADAKLIHVAIVDDTGIQYAAAKNTWSGVAAFETIGTLLIGTARQASGNAGAPQFDGKMLIFEMWESDAPVLKLVPIINADGVYCFYDAINGNIHASITDVPLEGGDI